MSTQNNNFYLYLIKPTIYDSDGYPIHWLHNNMPTNSLASIYGIALDCKERAVLGLDTNIIIKAIDESNTPCKHQKIISNIKNNNAKALVAFVGVQSNQFPRAIDLGAKFIANEIPVCIGGFHVSGIMSMFQKPSQDLINANKIGISLFSGEAEEGRFDELLKDAWNGQMKNIYDYSNQYVSIANEPTPFMPPENVKKTFGNVSSMDLSRGCPYNCSFCCIINVHGRKSRTRNADDLEKIVRLNFKNKTKSMFITDDNFARNKNWSQLLDRLIKLREEGIKMSFYIQADVLSHRIPGFVEKASQAGVETVFIGLENINEKNLLTVNKKHNKIEDYRETLLAWKKHAVITACGYIIGFPNDTKESILKDIDVIKKQLPVDMLFVNILTPLPGSADHKRLTEKGVWLDPDLNKYDFTHRVFNHDNMTNSELDEIYKVAWRKYYTFKHMETILRRMYALDKIKNINTVIGLFLTFGVINKVHNMYSYDLGLIRRKNRKDIREGRTPEGFFTFHYKYIIHSAKTLGVVVMGLVKISLIISKISLNRTKSDYRDAAITAPDIQQPSPIGSQL